MASLVAQMVKNLPAILETQVRSLSWDDLLEKATMPRVSCTFPHPNHPIFILLILKARKLKLREVR